jgi:Holliday junction resolvase-like predicted endonuclease
MSKQTATRKRAIAITRNYLKTSSFDIMDCNNAPGVDYVAREGSEIVFIKVIARCGSLPADPPVSTMKRSQAENAAAHWLLSHDIPSARVRFDAIAVNLIDAEKCFLRHHRDVLCCAVS